MTGLDRELLAEKTAAVERHLERVAARLPADASQLHLSADASDAVILHLWQAAQIVIVAVAALAREARVDLGVGDFGGGDRLACDHESIDPG